MRGREGGRGKWREGGRKGKKRKDEAENEGRSSRGEKEDGRGGKEGGRGGKEGGRGGKEGGEEERRVREEGRVRGVEEGGLSDREKLLG